jgi:hypothetical protein
MENDTELSGQPLENPRRETFARLYAAGGLSLAECWRKAGYSGKYAVQIQTDNAYKLTIDPQVSARITAIKQMAAHKDALTMQERRLALAAIVRTPATRFLGMDWNDAGEVLKLGPAVHAIKGMKTKSYEGDNGHMVSEADLDLYDKIAAIREDAILAGERRTDGSQTNVTIDLRAVLAGLGGSLVDVTPGASGPHAVDVAASEAIQEPARVETAGQAQPASNGPHLLDSFTASSPPSAAAPAVSWSGDE